MAYLSDFDLDDIVSILDSIGTKYTEGSKERDAIELAQIALLYPRHTGGSPAGRPKIPIASRSPARASWSSNYQGG